MAEEYGYEDFPEEKVEVHFTDVLYDGKYLYYYIPEDGIEIKKSIEQTCCVKYKNVGSEKKEYKHVTLVIYENDTVKIYKDYLRDEVLEEFEVDRERQDVEDLTNYSSATWNLTPEEKKIYVDGYKHGWWAAQYKASLALKDYREFH